MSDSYDERKINQRKQKLFAELEKAVKGLKDEVQASVFTYVIDMMTEDSTPRIEFLDAIYANKLACKSVKYVERLANLKERQTDRDVQNVRMTEMRQKKAYLRRCALDYDRRSGTQ